ncbi:MAG: ATP-dependent zinc metalloprotease FtsH [Lachnospiraceae bacterium]
MNENTNNNGSRGGRLAALLILLLALIFAVQFVRSSTAQNAASYTMDDFEKDIDDKNVTSVDIVPNAQTPTGYARITLHDGTTVTLYATDVTKVEDLARDAKLNPSVEDVADEGTFANYIFPLILVCVMIAFLFYFVNMQSAASGASNARMMNFGKSRAVRADPKNRVTFADVAGLDEEKEDLAEIVDFLKNPSHYTEVGARIPKGVLLEGPPGTGKTLLAKAVAGEAGVPFYSISGSDFVEMFVGVGASRVRDMFEEAKKDSPCIIFIDEIDAVARRRGTGLGGGHDEREQTLNQLLVEMDGFGPNEGIIVMAATNRADILDPAILRPGRFDRKITVSRPDVKGREEILKVHAKGKPLGDDVNLEEIARTTAGFSGADLENLLNEAAIAAARDNRRYIRQEDIKNAFIKVGIGTEKRSHVISPEEKRITAYHESGHAILFHELKDVGPVYTVSIIPTGNGAGGYTMPLPGKDEMYYTRGKMLHEIMVSLGGRIAEEVVLDDITTGASADIQRATSVARQMVTKYGMSSRLGTINYDTQEEDVFLGYDLGHETRNSEYMASEIDKEVKTIIDRCYADAKAIILKHRDVLDKSAALLIEKEKITGEEFDALFT